MRLLSNCGLGNPASMASIASSLPSSSLPGSLPKPRFGKSAASKAPRPGGDGNAMSPDSRTTIQGPNASLLPVVPSSTKRKEPRSGRSIDDGA